ncbi:MAG TPA: hypothetical protein VKT76_04465 [Bradyrhizobium sp.]|nr:hypothetical protein [Bradyrhizobium sp.]
MWQFRNPHRLVPFALLCGVLGGCSLSVPRPAEPAVTAAKPADQLVGQNLDALVAQLGPPTRSQSLDNDQTSVVWQFETSSETAPPSGDGGLYGDGSSPGYVSQGYSPFCRITAVVTTSSGIVAQASTEESNGTGATILRRDSICAKHLKIKSRT